MLRLRGTAHLSTISARVWPRLWGCLREDLLEFLYRQFGDESAGPGASEFSLLLPEERRFDRSPTLTDCIFCSPEPSRVIMQNELAFGYWDGYPVTPLHLLVIPHRHAANYFELTQEEVLACDDLLRRCRFELITRDKEVAGFNIGLNVGQVAGQTVFHCHYHLIPRREGDLPDPRGGVRAVFPGKSRY
jgi:diadenosine tetraphosphate (Ap4A) HIT family hydrolase